ncbi:MAG: DinB family protein [Chloroflexota bacterium]
MDRATIEELFDYTGWAWEQIGAALAPRGPEIITTDGPTSGWPALWDCLRHVSIGYDFWASSMDGRPAIEFDKAPPDWSALNDYHQRARKRLHERLILLDDVALATPREVETITGPGAYTPAQLFFNALWHDRGHHGDINTLLYQHGIPDDNWPWIEFRAFINNKRGYNE